MKRPVSLTVHKSQIERRQNREVRAEMISAARGMAEGQSIVAYAIVGFDRNGNAFAEWDTGKIMPKWAFPGAVSRVLDYDTMAIQDDYTAPLHRTNWPK